MCAVASGSWELLGGRCLRMADYVRGPEAPRRATAAAGGWCCLLLPPEGASVALLMLSPAKGVDRRENIEATSFADATFDVVISPHVFEHVDDRRAIGEMRRILRPSGLLLCMVPLIDGWNSTYENPSAVTARERDLHFGQADHVRYYGRDFRDRLGAGGFGVREYTAEGPARSSNTA